MPKRDYNADYSSSEMETIFSRLTATAQGPKAFGRGRILSVIVQNPLTNPDGTSNDGEVWIGSGSNQIYFMIPGQESPIFYAEDLKDLYIKLKFPFPNPNGGLLTANVATAGTGYTVGDVLTLTPTIGDVATVTVATLDGKVLTLSLNAPGVLYAPGDSVFLTAGNNQARVIVDTVGGGGEILTWHLSQQGLGYAPAVGVATTTTGAGAGATFDVLTTSAGVATVTVTTPGTGFAASSTYAATGGTGAEAVIRALTVDIVTPEECTVTLIIARERLGGRQ